MRGKKFAFIIRSYHKIVSKEETAPLPPRLNQPIHPIKGRRLVTLRQRRTIEGRVEVNQVDAFIREVLPVALNLKVVTVVSRFFMWIPYESPSLILGEGFRVGERVQYSTGRIGFY